MLRDREFASDYRTGRIWSRTLALLFIVALFLCPGAGKVHALTFTNISSAKFSNLSSMVTPRYRHTATLLSNGRVLVAGGVFNNFSGVTSNAQVYDPKTGKYAASLSMAAPRWGHTATMMRNGRVLLAGGRTSSSPSAVTNTLEVYDPLNGTSAAITTMTGVRYGHTATRMKDGRILLAGGINASGTAISSVEIYDPVADSFVVSPPPPALLTARAWHSATLLGDGRVVFSGGIASNGTTLTAIEIYDPATNTMVNFPTSGLLNARSKHAAVLRPDGTILVIGGSNTTTTEIVSVAASLASSTVAAGPTLQIQRSEPIATQLPNGDIVVTGGTILPPPIDIEILTGYSTQFKYLPPAATQNITGHTATLMPDGSVLVLGGRDNYTTFQPVANAQSLIFTGRSNAIAAVMPPDATPALNGGRQGHTSTRLPNGKVLIAGGSTTSSPGVHNTGLLYDPAAQTFTLIPSTMSAARTLHTATLLPNGMVLLVGGQDAAGTPLASADLYDPIGNTFVPVPSSLTNARYNHTASLLKDGRVLIAGGRLDVSNTIAAIEIYTPGIGFQLSTILLNAGIGITNHTATVLNDGNVLFTGGVSQTNNPAPSNTAEIYVTASDSMSAPGNLMSTLRFDHTAAILPDGNVLIAGGGAATAEIFNPTLNSFQASTIAMSNRHQGGTATVLNDGRVLIAGGVDGSVSSAIDVYDPATRTFSNGPSVQLSSPRNGHAASLLGDGAVLITGGDNGSALTLNTAELYSFDIPFGRRPVIDPFTAPPGLAIPPQPIIPILTGSLFSGDSEGSGGASPSASNHPVLTIHNVQTGEIISTDALTWSPISFIGNPLSTTLPQGVYTATITASGVPSIAQSFFVRPMFISTPIYPVLTQAGVPSTLQLLPILNIGNADLVVTGISLGGTDAAMFSLTAGGNCTTPPFTLTQFTSCDIGFVFTPPAGTVDGNRSAVINISSQDPDHILAPFSVALAGIVNTPPVALVKKVPTCDLNGDGKVDITDALRALQIAVGLIKPDSNDLANGDIAPLVNGKPLAYRKGYINLGDAIVILQKSLGIGNW